MKLLGDKIIVRKGEAFNLNLSIKDENGVPYILLDSIPNPHICLSVNSNIYAQDGDYNFNTWINIDKYFKAKHSVIEQCTNNEVQNGVELTDYRNGTICRTFNDIYYSVTNGKFETYEFKVHKKFLPLYTNKWIEGQYTYSISVVGGTLLTPILQTWYKQIYYSGENVELPTDNKILYEKIKKCRPDLVEGIKYNNPFASISYMKPLIKEGKLIIK